MRRIRYASRPTSDWLMYPLQSWNQDLYLYRSRGVSEMFSEPREV